MSHEIDIEEHWPGLFCGLIENMKSYWSDDEEGTQLESEEEPTVSIPVVPPVPHPRESYIVARNLRPAGWSSLYVYDPEALLGIETLAM